MRNGLLVDTSALIAFANPHNTLHEKVSSYVAQAIRDGVPLHISSLVAAEFSCRQSISDLDLKTFILDSFDIPEAVLSGKLDAAIPRDPEDSRVQHKVDIMLIAHAHKLGLAGILTADDGLAKYCDRLRELKLVEIHPLVLSDPYDPIRVTNPAHRSFDLPPNPFQQREPWIKEV